MLLEENVDEEKKMKLVVRGGFYRRNALFTFVD